MLSESEPLVDGCPITAFPVEVLAIDNATTTMKVRGDASLLCLDVDDTDHNPHDALNSLSTVIEETRVITFTRYQEMRLEYTPRHQVRKAGCTAYTMETLTRVSRSRV